MCYYYAILVGSLPVFTPLHQSFTHLINMWCIQPVPYYHDHYLPILTHIVILLQAGMSVSVGGRDTTAYTPQCLEEGHSRWRGGPVR